MQSAVVLYIKKKEADNDVDVNSLCFTCHNNEEKNERDVVYKKKNGCRQIKWSRNKQGSCQYKEKE